jgi:hypothetical protein
MSQRARNSDFCRLAFLRQAWIKFDLVWTAALIVTGAVLILIYEIRRAAGTRKRRHDLTIDTAAPEHVIVIDFFERFEAQVQPHRGRDQNDRRAIAIGFIEALDEVETAGTAGSCAGRETSGEKRFGRCREGDGLFMPHMDPVDLATME